MVDLKKIQKIYFIGIGGIGMSALARYFKFHGKEVSGYDKTETPLTNRLVAEGIPVHYQENLGLAPRDADIIVYTPAVPAAHEELVYYRHHGYTILKRSDVLGAITRSSFNICVAGTHGKTTITTMIAHILRHSEFGCNAFLGGISVNYNSNFWSNERNVCVVEADEYDRSFLKLSPDIAVITAMDADHLDIYGTLESVQQAYIEFAGKIKKEGFLFSHYGLERNQELPSKNHITYSLQDKKAIIHAGSIRTVNGGYQFDCIIKDWLLKDVVLNMGGGHNIENALVAIGIAHQLGIEDEKIKESIASFKGVKRRFEYIVKNDKQVYIDDYAHHPEELKALIGGAKSLFPGKKCVVVFQPHLYSRTRDLANEFAESLDLADEVVLLPIYPARELPIEGVNSELIIEKMKLENKRVQEKEELMEWLGHHPPELLITAGAGDIDAMVIPIKDQLEQ